MSTAGRFVFTAIILAVISPLIAQDEIEEIKGAKKVELLGGSVFLNLDTGEGSHVVRVSFKKSQRVNDKFLHVLKAFPRLSSLDLAKTKVTDEGLRVVGQLQTLTRLDLSQTTVTDLGVKELNQLQQLAVLDLCSTGITDDGIDSLTALTSLTTLKIGDTQITNEGLIRLKELKRLDALYLTDWGGGTQAAVNELKTFLPDLKVVFFAAKA